jgi:hypothetical protein
MDEMLGGGRGGRGGGGGGGARDSTSGEGCEGRGVARAASGVRRAARRGVLGARRGVRREVRGARRGACGWRCLASGEGWGMGRAARGAAWRVWRAAARRGACGRRRGEDSNDREGAGARPGAVVLGPLFSSARLRPTKIVVGQRLFSSASAPTHENTPHFRRSRGRRK